MTETIANTNEKTLVAELIEAKVALAKAEMQLEWQKAEQVKKDHSKPEPELMAPLFEALAKAQAEFEPVTATSRVTFKNVDFKFAPLSEILGAVRPALNKYGLTLTQQTKHIPFGIKVVTTLLHESGVSYDIESVPVFYNVNDIKNLGAQVTYLRRYEVKTLLGIEADSEELDMDNVPNQSQSVQQTGNYDSNHKYQSKAQTKTPRKPTGARYGKTDQSASLTTSLSSSEQTSLSEVTSANKVASDSVSQPTSESEVAPQKSEIATKGIKAACNDDQLIQMIARGEEAALSLGATESQLLEWSQLGESQGLTVQLKALSDFVSKQRQQAQQQ